MKRLLLATLAGCLLALCMAGVAESQCPGGVCPVQQPQQQWQAARPQQPRPFVCRIYNQIGRQRSIGSGTLVSKGQGYGVVLTCAHLFDEGTGTLNLRFPAGTNYKGTVIAKNRQHDLAFLKVTPRPTEPLVVMAPDYAKQGERITHAGYGQNGRYLEVAGSVIGYRKWANSSKAEVMDVTGGSRQGDSGGPILNARGELVGVLATTDNRTTQGVFNGRICAFAMENRYLFPWNADLAGKKDKNKLEANRPDFSEMRLPGEQAPLPQQQAPPVDLSGVNQRIGNLESQQAEQLKLIDDNAQRFKPLEETAGKARQLADGWPALQAALDAMEDRQNTNTSMALQAKQDFAKAVNAANSTKAEVDAALDEENPAGLAARLRTRLHDRLESTVTGKVASAIAAKTGFPIGAIGGGLGLLAVVLVLLVRKDIKDKIETGDPLLIEKIAARTRNQIDDRLAEKIGGRVMAHADPDHEWREELDDIKGMLGGLAGKVSAKRGK